MGNITGSVIAAIIITLLPEVLRDLADYRMLIYSIALIVMMLFSSNPTLVEFRKRFLKQRKGVINNGFIRS